MHRGHAGRNGVARRISHRCRQPRGAWSVLSQPPMYGRLHAGVAQPAYAGWTVAVHLIRLCCVALGVQSSAAGQWGRRVFASEARWALMHMGGRHRTWRNADAQGNRPRVGLCPGQVARRGGVQDIPHLHMYQGKTPCADCTTILCMCLCNPQAAHGSTHAATARYFERPRVRHDMVHPREKCTTRGLLTCERSWISGAR